MYVQRILGNYLSSLMKCFQNQSSFRSWLHEEHCDILDLVKAVSKQQEPKHVLRLKME